MTANEGTPHLIGRRSSAFPPPDYGRVVQRQNALFDRRETPVRLRPRPTHPLSGRRASPSPSSPHPMRERRRGARPAHSIHTFLLLFVCTFLSPSTMCAIETAGSTPAFRSTGAAGAPSAHIRASLTSCGRKKQLWFRSCQLLLEYRQVNLLSRGGAVRVAAPPTYGTLAQSAEQAAHNGPVPGSSPRCPTSRKAKNPINYTERRHIP